VKPYYDEGGVTIFHGDTLQVLRELPSETADLLMTDPPYSSGGMVRADRNLGVHAKYVHTSSFAGNALPSFSGDNRDQRSFGFWLSLWISESLRVVKDGAIAGLFSDWRQVPIVSDGLQAGGFVWRGLLTWYKPAHRPTQGRFANPCEFVVWGTRGPRALEGTPLPGFYDDPSPPGASRVHITQKPVSLMRKLIEVCPVGRIVLDPFLGSGTTLVAAKQAGRRAIGVEIEERYCEAAAKRLAQGALDFSDADVA
jgi:site-specific DNA-methyltransferase (adenine-specific)